ncbi:hypothetical protein ACHAQH_001265 [Verticillium albo-atrum]
MSSPSVKGPKRLTRNAYQIGWFSPLQVELQAAIHMLDEVHEKLPLPATDPNVYFYGAINGHNIVIVGLPEIGNYPTAAAAAHMRSTFPNLTCGVLVGIGGGVPTKSDAGMIRLGHVVVSKPTILHSGAINYSHGIVTDGVFKQTGVLVKRPSALLSAATTLDARLKASGGSPLLKNVGRMLENPRLYRKYKYPGIDRDPMSKHGSDKSRHVGPGTEIVVHRGTIATGELLLRHAPLGDELAKEYSVLCFEMEAAGALTGLPCLVVRGVSDYCDSLKNDEWHGFASAAAASYARELFFHLPRRTDSS